MYHLKCTKNNWLYDLFNRCDYPSTCFIPTKENTLNQHGVGKAMLYCAAGSNKMHFRRQKHRPSPYDINKRKPLNSLLNPMGRLGLAHGGTAARVRSSDSYSESSSGRDPTMPLLFVDEYHDLPFRDGLMYNSKTDKFPVPILMSRSKSLEDLRQSPNKSGSKQVRFKLVCYDDNSNGTASSNGSNSLESPLSVSPRTSFFNVLKGEASIKHEIDSMSMLIEKLDVAW